MSWRKHFTPVTTENNPDGSYSPFSSRGSNRAGPAQTNYSSYLPDVYVGSPNRVERYGQYNTMDLDSEVNAALDILAEFTTQVNSQNKTPFVLDFNVHATNSEITIIEQYLRQWCRLQEFETRMFRIMRNVFKYGDQVFVRDPETKKLFHVDPAKLTKIIVNESEGKKPEQYVIKDFNLNFSSLVATAPYQTTGDVAGTNGYSQGGARGMVGNVNTASGGRFQLDQENEIAVESEHIVHLSLSEGLDTNHPFGNSLLETVFKVFKQKELLEDAIIIYRVQRAPERRVFYVDVGNMPSHLAMQFVERVKTEIHQRRIPSATGGGQSVIDSAYNPLCLSLDTNIPLLDGRTLTLSELIEEFNQGKENWAYSCNPETGEVVPGVIDWAGVTRPNAEVIQLTFDNGETLVCTPDHKIPVFGRGFVEAKDITPTDSLISFNRQHKKISSNSLEYEQLWDHSKKAWIWTHRTVGEFFRKIGKHQEFTYLNENKGAVKSVVHHKDYDRFNNDPRNLQYMNKKDHILYHAAHKSEFWKNLSVEDRQQLCSKISNTLKEKWKNMTDEVRASALSSIRSAQKKGIWLRNNDPVFNEKYKKKRSVLRKQYLKENPAALAQVTKNLESRIKIKNQPLILTFEMLQIVADIVRTQSKNKNEVIKLCDQNQTLIDIVKQENSEPLDYKNAQCKIDFGRFGYSKLDRLLKKYGYKNWKHFVKEIDQFNHKVTKIEKVANRDTGTITIDGAERWHGYHTFAIEAGVFVKNSVNEDYFFPQTSEGRGSKVETLPGGCLAMDTSVSLLDGRELSIMDIEKEMNTGKELWTYSVDPVTGKIAPGLISWAGVTHKSAKVMRLTFDNGESLVCTPDHKFPVHGKEFLRADELKVNESMMSCTEKDTSNEYAAVSELATIEYLQDEIEVGTLTIDSDEKYHNYHTFALTCGVFTKNSNLGEIDDLRYFTNKLVRGLRIPSSYLPTGPDDGQGQYSDGRVGTAYIQELRFNTYCERLQNLIVESLNQEFKYYLLTKGINIDTAMFDICFQPPQNFAAYRQSEIDNARIPAFTQMSAIPYVSNRFAMKRFLGMSDEEIAENERLWREENDDQGPGSDEDTSGEIRGAGVSAAGIEADLGGVEDTAADELDAEAGAEPGADVAPAAPGAELPPKV